MKFRSHASRIYGIVYPNRAPVDTNSILPTGDGHRALDNSGIGEYSAIANPNACVMMIATLQKERSMLQRIHGQEGDQ